MHDQEHRESPSGLEIERKFSVTDESWRKSVVSQVRIRQGYLATTDNVTIRVRISDEKSAKLTIKSNAAGQTRSEYEYEIPKSDAESLLTMCDCAIISKTRHHVPIGGKTWEVDVFDELNLGLVIAEIELDSEDEEVSLPEWVGAEVTDDPRFYNAYLAQHPFTTWCES